MKDIAIVGAGASGLMAAIHASSVENRVVLFEKQKKAGRKLLVTGNGTCNITNLDIDVSHYHGKNPGFVNNVFGRFGLDETIDFFRSIGIPLAQGKNGRMYPASFQASTVLKILEYETIRRNVEINLHRRIDSIQKKGARFILTTAGREEFVFDSVILACGSCAYPSVGGAKIGYDLASSLGHRIAEPFPAILPVNIPLKIIHTLQGIKCDVELTVEEKGKTIAMSGGELLFTAYGISGPASLDISRAVNESILNGKEPEIVVDFFPDMGDEELRLELDTVFSDENRKLSFSLLGILKERLPEVLLRMAKIDPEKRVREISAGETERILDVLKRLRLAPGKPRDFNEAVAAAGGVEVDQINPATMESRIVKDLYITGELLDIDGDSGGYNLQFAWSTGAIAGMKQH